MAMMPLIALEIAGIGEQEGHVDDREQHHNATNDAREREDEGAQIEADKASPLLLLIGDVQGREDRLGERHDAPHRQPDAQAEAPAERSVRAFGKIADLLNDNIIGLCGQHRGQHAELILDRGWVRGQPIERDERRERREDGEQRVEGAARGDHGEIIAASLAPHSLRDLPPALERNVVRTPRVTPVRIAPARHAPMKERACFHAQAKMLMREHSSTSRTTQGKSRSIALFGPRLRPLPR